MISKGLLRVDRARVRRNDHVKKLPLATPQIPIRALHTSRSRNSTPRNATHHAARARVPLRRAPGALEVLTVNEGGFRSL